MWGFSWRREAERRGVLSGGPSNEQALACINHRGRGGSCRLRYGSGARNGRCRRPRLRQLWLCRRHNDGFISGDEWNTFRTRSYGDWDIDHDGRISQTEFESCYRAGGFYRTAYYNPDYWNNYWTGFDANGDGYLSPDEYWSTATWARIDRNNNGRVDSNEWVWWP